MITIVWSVLVAIPAGTCEWVRVALPCWRSMDHHLTPVPDYSEHRAQRLISATG